MYRIKTEDEFIAEYGEEWRAREWVLQSGRTRHLWPDAKDGIFGRPLEENMRPKIIEYGKYTMRYEDKVWTITEEMITEEEEIEF